MTEQALVASLGSDGCCTDRHPVSRPCSGLQYTVWLAVTKKNDEANTKSVNTDENAQRHSTVFVHKFVLVSKPNGWLTLCPGGLPAGFV